MTYIKKKLRQYRLKIQRQRRESLPPPPADHTAHTCPNCGAHYHGRYCPQCSMPASWKRMTLKSLTMGFLDVWGMGNRPIFRSIEQLFLRPGYMIRDYLAGHHLRYFPPFKMLAVLIVLMVLAAWIVFRRCGLNLVETTFSQIYINCQMQVVAILWVLLTGTISPANFAIRCIRHHCTAPLFYDFRQLYRLKMWATI